MVAPEKWQQQPGEIAPKVRVASYSNTTWQGAFRSRARAYWGSGLLGFVSGAGIGAIVVAAMALVGTPLTSAAAILTPIITLAAVGGGMGVAIAGVVGGPSGAVAAGLAEGESRFKQMMYDAGLFDQKMLEKDPVTAQQVETEMVESEKEVNLRGRQFNEFVNWKATLTFVALGAVLGGLLAYAGVFGGGIGSMVGTLGEGIATKLGVSPVVGSVMSGGLLMGAAAIPFGINYPIISNWLNNKAGKVFSGQIFEPKEQKISHAKAPVIEHAHGTNQKEHKNTLAADIVNPATLDIKKQQHHIHKAQHQGVVDLEQLALDLSKIH